MARILFVTSRFPYPLDKGDKLRAFNQIKALAQRHEVHLFSLSEEKPSVEDLDQLQRHCASVNNHTVPRWKRMLRLPLACFGNLPLQVCYFKDDTARRALHSLCVNLRPDVIHLHLIRMGPYLTKDMAPRVTMDFMDCFSIGAEREASVSRWPKRYLLRLEGDRVARYERSMMEQVDAGCVISPADRVSMPVHEPEALTLVPNGVDLSVFQPLDRTERFHVFFTGHMGYPPNIVAALYAAQEVLPRLRKRLPGTTFLIAGKGAPGRIKRLQGPFVEVMEHVDPIREAFAMCRVMIAPMRISIGLQNKILQAMAMGIPVVTNAQGNAAIGGEHGRDLLVADDAEALADAVHRLLSDRALYDRIRENGIRFVKERFTWESACQVLEHMLVPPTRA